MQPTSARPFWLCLLAAAALAFVQAGCGQRASVEAVKPPVAKDRQDKDRTQSAMELLGQQGETAQLREALQMLSPRGEVQSLTAADKEFFKTRAHLSDAELEDVESGSFRRSDAYYLDECFLLRDVARHLEVAKLDPLEQAEHCLRWITRHVLLHEQGYESPPTAYVLRRGFGNARDWAVSFLALMRQFQLDGCLVVLPGDAPRVVYAGLMLPGDSQIYLFDPRLGTLVRAQGKAATLAMATQDPALLKAAEVAADQAKSLETWLVCPLHSMAPRMAYLEQLIQNSQSTVVLYQDAPKLFAAVSERSPVPTKFWNLPADGASAASPVRALRAFLPPEEGGEDATKLRLAEYRNYRLPLTPIVRLGQLRLASELHRDAFAALFDRFIGPLFSKYVQQPQEMLLRGQQEKMISRLGRIRDFLEDDSLSMLTQDPAAQRKIAAWREQANAAYIALQEKRPDGQAQVGTLLTEDQYLVALLQTDAEEQQAKAKKILTRIVGFACREPLSKEWAWLTSLLWSDRAEQAQLAAAESGDKVQAQEAWLTARSNWSNRYLGAHPLGQAELSQRLAGVQETFRSKEAFPALSQATGLLEGLALDLHRFYAAKLNLADAIYRRDGAEKAREYLASVNQELDHFDRDQSFKKAIDQVLERVETAPLAPAVRDVFRRRLQLLQRDWTERGNFFWLQRQFRARLAALPA